MTHQSIFVGREQLIEKANRVLQNLRNENIEDLTKVITLTGPGGIGKTKLLMKLHELNQHENALWTSEIVDLKATMSRSPVSLLYVIVNSITRNYPKSHEYFSEFYRILGSYNAAQAGQKYDLYDGLIQAFTQNLVQASVMSPIVIFLDTFETIQDSELCKFLLEIIPNWAGKICVVIAGRNNISVAGSQLLHMEIGRLTLIEISNLGRKLFASRPGLSEDDFNIAPDILGKIEYLTEGKPILVTLAFEWILEKVRVEEIISINKELFEQEMVNFLGRLDREDYREREAIVMMATIDKRLTPEIMSILTDWTIDICQKVCAQLERFSFVKIIENPQIPNIKTLSESTKLITLHDEMLRLVREYVDHPKRVKDKWRELVVKRYYRKSIENETNPQLRNALSAESLYYNLWYAPPDATKLLDQQIQVAVNNYDFDYAELLVTLAKNPYINLSINDINVIDLAYAEMLVKKYQPFEAKEIFDRLIIAFNPEKETEYASRSIAGLGACIANGATIIEANLTEAISLWEQSLAMTQGKAPERTAIILYQLGYGYDLLGQHNEALNYYQQSNKLARELDDLKLVTKTLDDMGRLRRKRYEVTLALPLFVESLELKEAIKDPKSIAISYHYMGDVYRDLNEFSKALEWYAKAEKAMRDLNDLYGLCVLYGDIGWLYLLAKDYDKSLEYTNKSYYDLALKHKFGREMAEMEHSYYHILLDTKGIDEALPWIQKAFQNADKYSNTFIYLDAALHIIEAAYDKKNYEEIEFYYEKMEELDRKGCGYRMFKGRATNILGDVAYDRGTYEQALDYWIGGYTIIAIHGRSRSSVLNFHDHLRSRCSKFVQALTQAGKQPTRRLIDLWSLTPLDSLPSWTLDMEYPAFVGLCYLAQGDILYSEGSQKEACEYWHSGLTRIIWHNAKHNSTVLSLDLFLEPRSDKIEKAMKIVENIDGLALSEKSMTEMTTNTFSMSQLYNFSTGIQRIRNLFNQ